MPPPPEFRTSADGFDPRADRVIGFASALSDGVLSTYLSRLEVLPDHQRRGVGSELMRVCDESLAPFYARLGFIRTQAMSRSGEASPAGEAARSDAAWAPDAARAPDVARASGARLANEGR